MWVLEDLQVTASVCRVDPASLFSDAILLLASETPGLERGDADYAGAVNQLLEWFFEDIDSVARSFDADPVDVFEYALKTIAEDTPLLTA